MFDKRATAMFGGRRWETVIDLCKKEASALARLKHPSIVKVHHLAFTHWYFTSPHFTSLHFTSLHFTSLHFTSLYYSYHLLLFSHHTSLQLTSLHFTSLYFTSLLLSLIADFTLWWGIWYHYNLPRFDMVNFSNVSRDTHMFFRIRILHSACKTWVQFLYQGDLLPEFGMIWSDAWTKGIYSRSTLRCSVIYLALTYLDKPIVVQCHFVSSGYRVHTCEVSSQKVFAYAFYKSFTSFSTSTLTSEVQTVKWNRLNVYSINSLREILFQRSPRSRSALFLGKNFHCLEKFTRIWEAFIKRNTFHGADTGSFFLEVFCDYYEKDSPIHQWSSCKVQRFSDRLHVQWYDALCLVYLLVMVAETNLCWMQCCTCQCTTADIDVNYVCKSFLHWLDTWNLVLESFLEIWWGIGVLIEIRVELLHQSGQLLCWSQEH